MGAEFMRKVFQSRSGMCEILVWSWKWSQQL